MIVIFHLFTNIFYNLCKRRINARNSSWSNFTLTKQNSDRPLAQRDAENDIKFDPPVYKQRYERATEVLTNEKWKNQISKVVDFGCAEFGLFVFLKNAMLSREILCVDIDELLLRDYLYRIYPLIADHLLGRKSPLTVKVFAGSISEPDSNLLNTDAVVAIEIIEHLYPDTLDALPYNLFWYIRPKLVIVTTPNADFNVLFEKLEKFRHADHKFEWTREQFQSWATNITLRFSHYMVEFDGVGLGPGGSENLGCCSQIAVFIRKDIICDNYEEEIIPCACVESTCKLNPQSDCFCNCWDCLPKSSHGVCSYNSYSQKVLPNSEDSYKLLVTIEYPSVVDPRTEEEKNLDELKYRMHLFENIDEKYFNVVKNRVEIPLNRLVYETSGPFLSESEVRALLLKFNYQIEECLSPETEQVETCVIYEPEMESGSSGSDTGASGYGSDKGNADDTDISDWDDKDVATWNDPQNKDKEKPVAGVKAQLHLEVSGSKKQQEALFDSGYQKSPSVPDESPQSFSMSKDEAIALDFKSLNTEKTNKLSNILSVFDNFDKINELDAFRKEKKYFNFSSNLPHREVMKKICQEIAKHPIAGPSRDPKKIKPKKSQSSDSDDSVDDVKSITTCILENSLNKIECQDEEPRGNLIQEFIPEAIPEEIPAPPDEPILIVENGDLANNNRDLEGNNYPAENEENPQPQNDNAVDNLERNVNIDNNNAAAPVPIEEEAPVIEVVEENIEIEPLVNVEVAWSSREALFDANSHVDLLEDFEMDASVAVVNGVVFPSNFVVVTNSNSLADGAVLPPEESGFPNWLLQIFEEGEVGLAEDDLHDEPHFYCQGDGLGVHPSTVALNDDADDDEGNESGSDSSSSSSSTSGSVDFANAENNSIQEVFMTPDGSRNENLVVVGQPLPPVDQNEAVDPPEQEESYASAEGSDSHLVIQ